LPILPYAEKLES